MDLKIELSRIKEVLKDNPRGMTVTEIAKAVKMNRHSVAKYLDMLFVSGHVEMKAFGSSKVFYPARRLPMSAILNFSSDFILVLNKDQEIINANDRFLAFERIKKEDILNRSIVHASFPMEFSPSIIPNIREALEGKETDIEATLKKDREEHCFAIKFIPTVFDDAEKGVTIIFEDVTARRQAEAALRESEERFRAIFEHAAVGIAYLAKDGSILRTNQRYCDILGYTKEELARLNNMELTHPDDVEATAACLNKFMAGGMDSCSMEKRFIRKDGGVVWVSLTVSCIREPGGALKYFIPVIEDITARKRAEEALLRAREELEARVNERTAALQSEIEKSRSMEAEVIRTYRMMHDIIEKAPFGIYVVNEAGSIEYVNPAMLKISGDDERSFKSLNVFELPTYRSIGLSDRIISALRGEYFYLGPVEYTSHYGKKTSTRNFIGMPMEEGGMKKVLVFVEDISGQKSMEEKLQKNEALLRDIVNNLK